MSKEVVMSESRKADHAQADAMRPWAHRVLDELLDDVGRRDFFGSVALEMSVERGVVQSVLRRYEGRVKPPKFQEKT